MSKFYYAFIALFCTISIAEAEQLVASAAEDVSLELNRKCTDAQREAPFFKEVVGGSHAVESGIGQLELHFVPQEEGFKVTRTIRYNISGLVGRESGQVTVSDESARVGVVRFPYTKKGTFDNQFKFKMDNGCQITLEFTQRVEEGPSAIAVE